MKSNIYNMKILTIFTPNVNNGTGVRIILMQRRFMLERFMTILHTLKLEPASRKPQLELMEMQKEGLFL